MKIFLLFSLSIIAILLIGKDIIYTLKRHLLKDQAEWSGKDIKIKYTTSGKASGSKDSENYLKMIADESKIYLEEQSEEKENDND